MRKEKEKYRPELMLGRGKWRKGKEKKGAGGGLSVASVASTLHASTPKTILLCFVVVPLVAAWGFQEPLPHSCNLQELEPGIVTGSLFGAFLDYQLICNGVSINRMCPGPLGVSISSFYPGPILGQICKNGMWAKWAQEAPSGNLQLYGDKGCRVQGAGNPTLQPAPQIPMGINDSNTLTLAWPTLVRGQEVRMSGWQGWRVLNPFAPCPLPPALGSKSPLPHRS